MGVGYSWDLRKGRRNRQAGRQQWEIQGKVLLLTKSMYLRRMKTFCYLFYSALKSLPLAPNVHLYEENRNFKLKWRGGGGEQVGEPKRGIQNHQKHGETTQLNLLTRSSWETLESVWEKPSPNRQQWDSELGDLWPMGSISPLIIIIIMSPVSVRSINALQSLAESRFVHRVSLTMCPTCPQ